MAVVMLIIWLLLGLLLAVVAFFYLAFLWETWSSRKPGRVLYVGSNVREQGPLLEKIVRERVAATEQCDLVELGAGLALISAYLADRFAWRSVQAVELGWVIRTLGRLRLALLGQSKRVSFLAADMFQYQPPPGSLVYCYLLNKLLDRLYEEGRLKGCLVISLTFAIQGVQPDQVIPLKGWQGRLYVYDFRTP